MNAVSCSLNAYDQRVIISDDDCFCELSPDLIIWLETFVGPITIQGGTDPYYQGVGWSFDIISTTGITDLNLTFDDAKHGAMFKLVYGYDLEYV